jgi:SAM-dependent methyltransferase
LSAQHIPIVAAPRACRRLDPVGWRLRRNLAVNSYAGLPLEPLSDRYGADRGTPLDRRYIESFLAERRGSIGGSVLEVQDDAYTTQFGAERVSESAVVDIDPANRRATLIADLEQPDPLLPESYDCIILTQTLHLLRRPGQCVDNCYRALRPAGVLLVTVPSVSRVSPTYPDADYWRFTPAGIAELFARHWRSDFTVHAKGNLRSCIGFLLGEVVEELADTVLDTNDSRFPLTVAVEAHKT